MGQVTFAFELSPPSCPAFADGFSILQDFNLTNEDYGIYYILVAGKRFPPHYLHEYFSSLRHVHIANNSPLRHDLLKEEEVSKVWKIVDLIPWLSCKPFNRGYFIIQRIETSGYSDHYSTVWQQFTSAAETRHSLT